METGTEIPKNSPEQSYRQIGEELQSLHTAGLFRAMRMISVGHNHERSDFGVVREITHPRIEVLTPSVPRLKEYMRGIGPDKVPAELSRAVFSDVQKISRVSLRLQLDRLSRQDEVTGSKLIGLDELEALCDADGSILVGFLRKKPEDPRTLVVEQKRFEKKDWDPANFQGTQPAALYLTQIYDNNQLPPEEVRRN